MTREPNRREFVTAAGLAGIAGLAGCAGGDGDGTPTDAGDGTPTEPADGTPTDTQAGTGTPTEGEVETRLSWHAGGTGGTYFPLSNEFKVIVEANTDYTLNVQSTGASVENVGSLADGSADFALIQNDIAFFARNGTGIDVFEGNPIENLVGVATLYPETIHVVTRAGSGIETVADLQGATINTGDLGSGTQVNALQILEAVGVDQFTEQNTGFSQAAEQIQNNDIDAAFVVGGWPVGAIEELATTTDIEIVEVAGEDREAAKEAASWFADDTIPGGTYEGIDEDRETVSVQAMIATNAEQPDVTVETITRTIFENAGELTIKQDFITRETALDGMSIELHPGAAAYLEG